MWTSVEIGGKKADAFEPPGPARPRFGVMHLHGISEKTLVDSEIFTQLLEKHQLACLCPHGRRAWWADRVCKEFDPALTPERYLLDQVMPFFKERWGLASRAIGLMGISMGGQGALRLAFKHSALFPVVAGISSALDFHERYHQDDALQEMYGSQEECRQDTAILHVPPVHYPPHIYFCIDPVDPWLRGNERLDEKLTALGIPHEMDLTTEAGGHSWTYFESRAPQVMQFIHDGLVQESRRLL